MKLAFLAALTLTSGLLSPVFSVSYGSDYWDKTKALDDLKSCADFKEDFYPLIPSCFGHEEKDTDTDYQVIAMADGIDGWRTAYVYLYHPSGYANSYYSNFATKKREAPGGYRFNVSMTAEQDGYALYDASLVNESDDLRFLKFKVSGDFSEQSTKSSRLYDFAGFGIRSADLSASNDYAQGKRFTFSKDSTGVLRLKTDDIKNVKITGFADDVTLPGETGKTADTLGLDLFNPRAATSSKLRIHDYIFTLDRNLGDLVGIKLHYTLQAEGAEAMPIEAAVGDVNYSDIAGRSISKDLYFYDYQYRSFSAWKDSVMAANIWAGGFAVWADVLGNIITGTSDVSGDIPVIEKLGDPESSKGWLIDGGKLPTMTNNPHLLGQIGNDWAVNQYEEHKDIKDIYLIHFSASDLFCCVDPLSNSHFTKWYSKDVQPIELTLRKDGRNYILGVSADAVKGVEDTAGANALPDWEKVWKLILTMLAGVAIVVVGCAIVDWAMSSPKGASSND